MPANLIRAKLLTMFFYAFVLTLMSLAISLSAFMFSALTLDRGVIFQGGILRSYQKAYYWTSITMWQWDPRCSVFDPELIYAPRLGRCEYVTPEFETVLNFDENGRAGGKRTDSGDSNGIAVVGDSHSMGWGVNDDETFSAILERMVGRPVYNMGVSSYATRRELRRLERSGLISKVDTIIIQYCRNDLMENQHGLTHAGAFKAPTSTPTQEWFNSLYIQVSASRRAYIWGLKAIEVPTHAMGAILSDSDASIGEDFTPHYAALINVLSEFPWLKDKRVIVFYVNPPHLPFRNFEQPENQSSLEFVDISLDQQFYFSLDPHMNSAGHQRTAEMLLPIVLDRADGK